MNTRALKETTHTHTQRPSTTTKSHTTHTERTTHVRLKRSSAAVEGLDSSGTQRAPPSWVGQGCQRVGGTRLKGSDAATEAAVAASRCTIVEPVMRCRPDRRTLVAGVLVLLGALGVLHYSFTCFFEEVDGKRGEEVGGRLKTDDTCFLRLALCFWRAIGRSFRKHWKSAVR